MPVDEALLAQHRAFEDQDQGWREEFRLFSVGPGTVLGTLTTPLGPPRPVACVICQSFGMEQVDLQSLESTLARRLAASGHPVLRFQCLGYGDSEPGDEAPNVLTHIRDTEAAADYLRAETGASGVAFVGARFGGTVAALVADRIGAEALVTIGAVINGGQMMNDLLRSVVMREMVRLHAERVPSVKELREEMERSGIVDVRGFPLTRKAFELNNQVELVSDLRQYAGRSLVVQVSRGEATQTPSTKLSTRLRELGGDVSFEVVTDPWASALGQPRFAIQGDAQVDVLGALYESLSDLIVSWFDAPAAARADADAEAEAGREAV